LKPTNYICYELYSLNIAGTAERTCFGVAGASSVDFVLHTAQATLYLRQAAKGEEYWWH
jgi:hypothetical protein